MTGVTLLLLLPAAGQLPSGFEVRTIAGDSVSGGLQSVAADGSVVVGDKTTAAPEWYAIRRTDGILPPWPRVPHLELTNGDRVAGTIADADGDALRLRLSVPGAADQVVRIPLSALRAAWLTTRPADAADPDWLTAPRKRDLFLARNGDSTTGALTAIDAAANAVRFQSDGKDHRLELSKLAAIGFNTDLARVRRPKGPFYRLTLADGTRFSAQAVAFDGRIWSVATLFKDRVRVPAEHVVSVDVEQGPATHLSDLKPTRYEYRTFDGEQFMWAGDRSVAGRPLTLRTAGGESTFNRGLGLHAECTLTYSLAGKYRRLETLAGLDALTGVKGTAMLAVLVDGKEHPLPSGGRLTCGEPLPIRVDLSGARELTVILRRGSGAHIQDHVDLADARLIP